MLRAMTPDELTKAIERSEMLMNFIQSIDWSSVQQIIVEWADDGEVVNPTTFGEEPSKTKPTREVMSIHIICEPGFLPVPRDENGSPTGDGVFI